MSTQIFLGNPPAHIRQWIIEHTQLAGHAKTWIKFSEIDTWHEYEIKDAMDCPALVSAGLMPEGSGTEIEPDWITQPYAVEIGTDVTSIGEFAFYGCSSLTSAKIPDSVTSIGHGAFIYCENLTSVMISNNVTSIGNDAFSRCCRLTSVTIPDGVTNISSYAFNECESLTSIDIPNSVTSIGEGVFRECSGLTSVIFLGKTMDDIQNIEDGNGHKYYPWGIEDESIIDVQND